MHLCYAGMKIKVDVDSKLSFIITVQLHDSIKQVKLIICRKLYIPTSMQMLRLLGEILEDDKTVGAYNIKEDYTISLIPQGDILIECFINVFSSNFSFLTFCGSMHADVIINMYVYKF